VAAGRRLSQLPLLWNIPVVSAAQASRFDIANLSTTCACSPLVQTAFCSGHASAALRCIMQPQSCCALGLVQHYPYLLSGKVG